MHLKRTTLLGTAVWTVQAGACFCLLWLALATLGSPESPAYFDPALLDFETGEISSIVLLALAVLVGAEIGSPAAIYKVALDALTFTLIVAVVKIPAVGHISFIIAAPVAILIAITGVAISVSGFKALLRIRQAHRSEEP